LDALDELLGGTTIEDKGTTGVSEKVQGADATNGK
jgi:hypothetical protein